MSERFKKPTDQQLIEIAILYNDGQIDEEKLACMVAMASFIIDRLYEHGHVSKKSEVERKIEQEECRFCDGCGWYEGGPTLKTICKHCNGTGIKQWQ